MTDDTAARETPSDDLTSAIVAVAPRRDTCSGQNVGLIVVVALSVIRACAYRPDRTSAPA
jgi:hypothetical protein